MFRPYRVAAFPRTCPSSLSSAPKNQSSSGGISAAVEWTSSRSFSPRARNLPVRTIRFLQR